MIDLHDETRNASARRLIGSMIQPPVAAKITTFSGRQVDPFDLRVADIDWNDVVAVLPRLPRFNGHTRYAYSVAQHSVLVASLCQSRDAKRWGLMHDVAEIYLHDVPTQVKNRLLCRVFPKNDDDAAAVCVVGAHGVCLREYDSIELDALEVIAERFGLIWPIPAEVWESDKRALETEWEALMPCAQLETLHSDIIEPLTEDEARRDFVEAAQSLFATEVLACGMKWEAAE